VAAVGAAGVSRQRACGLRRQHDAACTLQRGLTRQDLAELGLARQHAHGTHEAVERDSNPGDLVGDGLDAVKLPVGDERFGKAIAQEAEARNDDRIAVFVGLDVDQGHGQHVPARSALDMDRASQRVHQVEIGRGHVVRLGVEVEI
jgi:hypothetical protein